MNRKFRPGIEGIGKYLPWIYGTVEADNPPVGPVIGRVFRHERDNHSLRNTRPGVSIRIKSKLYIFTFITPSAFRMRKFHKEMKKG